MKSFIVSLGQPTTLSDQLSKNDFTVEVVGVNGRHLSAGEYFSIISNRVQKIMTPGEVGCALSHIKIYEKISMSSYDGYYLILEDDVSLSDKFFETIDLIANTNFDVVILGGQDENPDRFYLWAKIDEFGVASITPFFAKKIWSTCGYLINKKTAISILEIQRKNLSRSDSWGAWSPLLGLNLGFINIVIHPSDRSKSLIEGERRLIDRYKNLRNIFFVSFIRFLRFMYYAIFGLVCGGRMIFKSSLSSRLGGLFSFALRK